ncbi:AbrB family transcriptional regulator [Vulcanisaeta sp. EB80]|uniref:AbrB/MazE/SpoVT family DNA-binding domain-containing protein n=1 Tax=Vulcanisaeta sp. EB80 TaxID=1650660 RepID=UPI0009BCF2EC|nr:AbrB/MazE/SpoVT family DNA-binding domain-containing protein [Vulcanisaeta sp. EB80]PLC68999.1 AbrB family transcriptional regulator [Vulcanisaeta sp. EB80]
MTTEITVGRKGLPINTLPYTIKIYINNQVLVPANLVRKLGLERTKYAYVVLEHNNQKIELTNVKLLRTKHTSSRQFTIPREVREKFGIKPFDMVTIHIIRPINISMS